MSSAADPPDGATLPGDANLYRRTDLFTETSIPAGLLKAHSTKPGVWGLIRVIDGALTYRVEDPRRPPSTSLLTAEAAPGVIEPTILHSVEPQRSVRFYVEFYRRDTRAVGEEAS
jgi:tellurite resistance-related uncharacterized protein